MGSAAPMLIGIAVVPYIYKQIGIERIGVLTIIWALIGYFSIFDFGLGRAITQRIAGIDSNRDNRLKITIATTGVYLTLLVGMLGGLIGFASIELVGVSWVKAASDIDHEIRISFLLACLAVPAATATAGLRGILEGEQRFGSINFLKMALGLFNFLGPMVSIFLFGPKLNYIVGSLVLTRYIILLGHYVPAKNSIGKLSNSLNRQESMKLIQFGGWMTVSNIVSPLMVVADRFLISSVLGAAVVAFYTIPADFLLRILVLPAAITSSTFPVFSKYFSEKNFGDAFSLYKKTIIVIALMMTVITTIIFLGGSYGLDLWLGREFAEKSFSLVCVLAVGILFNSIAQIPHAYIQASGDARSTAQIHVFESSIYIPLLFLLMHKYGIIGASFAWMLRALLDLFLLHCVAKKIIINASL